MMSGLRLWGQVPLAIDRPWRAGHGNIGSDLAGGAIEFAFLGPGAAKPFIEVALAKALRGVAVIQVAAGHLCT